MQPLVSIIIPTYNRAHLIGETLDSILAQTYTYWECIVVDDGSTDDTETLLQKYIDKDSRFQYHKRPDTHLPGGNGARNYGFEVSNGEYIQWFDSDDIIHKDKLTIQIPELIALDFNFSVCQTLVFDNEKENIVGLHNENIISDNSLFDFIRRELVFLTPSAVYKRKFLNHYALMFNEKLKAAQEWEFICKVLFYSPQYHVVRSPLVFIRKHNNSISYNKNQSLRRLYYYQARIQVFQFLLKKGSIKPNTDLKDFFKIYFINNFKILLFSNRFRAVSLYSNSLKHLYSPVHNLKHYFYIGFVIITNSGYTFKDRIIK